MATNAVFYNRTFMATLSKNAFKRRFPMDTTLSSRVPGTVVPNVMYRANKNCIKLHASWTLYFKNTMVQVQNISVYNISNFVYSAFNTQSV